MKTAEEINEALQQVGIDFEFVSNVKPSFPRDSGNKALFRCLICNRDSIHRKDRLESGQGKCPYCKANNTKQLEIRKEIKKQQLQDRLLLYGFNFFIRRKGTQYNFS